MSLVSRGLDARPGFGREEPRGRDLQDGRGLQNDRRDHAGAQRAEGFTDRAEQQPGVQAPEGGPQDALVTARRCSLERCGNIQ